MLNKITYLSGPNGAGKTKALSEASMGRFDDKIFSSSRHEKIVEFAYASQGGTHPIPSAQISSVLTVPLLINGYSLSDARLYAQEVLARFGFSHLFLRSLHNLSGGEEKVIHLLQAVALNSTGLILDDPFGMLDKERILTVSKFINNFLSDGLVEIAGKRELVVATTDLDMRDININNGMHADILHVMLPSSNTIEMRLHEAFSRVVRFAMNSSSQYEIAFHDVCFQCGGRTTCLPFSAEMRQGNCYVLIGPNGAGKSLAMRAIIGKLGKLFPTMEGDVTVCNGVDKVKPEIFRNQCVFVPQHSENIFLGSGVFDAIVRILSGSNCDKKTFDMIRTTFPRNGNYAMSAGESRFWICVASGLAAITSDNYSWWLLDEPDAHLDIVHHRLLASLIQIAITVGKGVVMVTHRPELFPFAKNIPILAKNI